ncbi:MAG: diacylglycerol kinase family protein [Bacteroidales bacterium]
MKKWFWKELKSFGYAFRGLGLFFKTETHAKIHLFAAVVVIVLGQCLQIKTGEWLLVIFAIALVWIAEIFNTAIEKLTDKLWGEENAQAAFIKDVAAAGVLVAAIAAVAIGIIVFLPYILS